MWLIYYVTRSFSAVNVEVGRRGRIVTKIKSELKSNQKGGKKINYDTPFVLTTEELIKSNGY